MVVYTPSTWTIADEKEKCVRYFFENYLRAKIFIEIDNWHFGVFSYKWNGIVCQIVHRQIPKHEISI